MEDLSSVDKMGTPEEVKIELQQPQQEIVNFLPNSSDYMFYYRKDSHCGLQVTHKFENGIITEVIKAKKVMVGQGSIKCEKAQEFEKT
jgi:hypothetical protein